MPTRQIHFPSPEDPLIPVIFRTWKHDNYWDRGGVIALFPTLPEEVYGRGGITSYEHVGQHGGAYWHIVLPRTRPSTPDEIAPLLAELGQIGYRNLVIYRRWPLSTRRM